MTPNGNVISLVPTNIITGFLGAGKTSAIVELLKNKPQRERWAVLVNEFGEIGVDGALLAGQSDDHNTIFIREVPGGCMCCAASIPMQVALNQLLQQAKPDRLLIEPTGLGHPNEIVQILSSKYYRKALLLQKIITLVDARNLGESRYIEHDTFNEQIAIADVVIGNKQDLYNEDDQAALKDYVKAYDNPLKEIKFTQNGKLDVSWLSGNTKAVTSGHSHHGHAHSIPNEEVLPDDGAIKAINKGEGFYSIGWRFGRAKIFSRQKLFDFFNSLRVERMKAAFITDSGFYSYNLTPDSLLETPLNNCTESKVEFINHTILVDEWENQLSKCLTDNSLVK